MSTIVLPWRRKISNFKTRADGTLQSWQTTYLVENYRNNCMGRWYSSALDSKSSKGGYTTNYTRNPKCTMPIYVDGCCIMTSPIVESDRIGNPITVKALSGESGNAGCELFIPVCQSNLKWKTYITINFNPNNRMMLLMIQWHKLVLKTGQIMAMTTEYI